MKIFNESGSKERFNEMFERVAKTRINESLDAGTVLELAFKELRERKLNIINQRTYSTNTNSYIEIVGTDRGNNSITFTFKVMADEDLQDGVYNITDAIVTSFTFDSQDQQDSVVIDENGLTNFSQGHKNEIIEIVSEYVDFEDNEPDMTEELQNAINKIDSYNIDVNDNAKKRAISDMGKK